MNDNIVEVIPGIFGEIKPERCMISSLAKKSRVYTNKRLRVNGEWKTITIHRLVLGNSLGRSIKPEYFVRPTCDVGKCINFNHLWEGFRLKNSQDRLRKEGAKNVGSTSVPKPQEKLRGREVIPSIRGEIQPKGCIICTLAKRSDGYSVKGTKVNGKTKSFYPHRLVIEDKLGRLIKPGYFACHSCADRGCVNTDDLWEGTPADNCRDAKRKKPFCFCSGPDRS
ncbi:HNH endonuclease [Microcoleus sp. LEGE 07076]|uniref:HNH endonuclease n=1 Tax=Microcoleus sp. LEGE 07076 TaxID=915322 RepID=UPI00187F9EB3|nr:HNH endonuclease [Microcoleus sp. LEGE 07076]MBE9188025.1 HNH endonuclease [Microcoleus sp. LEGE 07076]